MAISKEAASVFPDVLRGVFPRAFPESILEYPNGVSKAIEVGDAEAVVETGGVQIGTHVAARAEGRVMQPQGGSVAVENSVERDGGVGVPDVVEGQGQVVAEARVPGEEGAGAEQSRECQAEERGWAVALVGEIPQGDSEVVPGLPVVGEAVDGQAMVEDAAEDVLRIGVAGGGFEQVGPLRAGCPGVRHSGEEEHEDVSPSLGGGGPCVALVGQVGQGVPHSLGLHGFSSVPAQLVLEEGASPPEFILGI